jgi:hypothetical protein
MSRLDLLKASLLASLTACGPAGFTSDGETGSGSESESGPGSDTTTTETETETGGGIDACEAGCEGATMIADGWVQCPDGTINRMYPGVVEPTIAAEPCMGTEDEFECMTDADCTGSAFSTRKCVSADEWDAQGLHVDVCKCAYACASDEECQTQLGGTICTPPEIAGEGWDRPQCLHADCFENSQCGECGECALAKRFDGCGTAIGIACRTASDECRTSDECSGLDCFPYFENWSCVGQDCFPGRPLLVDERARTASARQRDDWMASRDELPGELREDVRLAAHWSEVAALEHASVASFARFGLQLLSLGAPPELLRATARAALDEVAHARLAYGLASAYGGARMGPGSLDLRGALAKASWREVVRGLIVEACVGETLNVAEAMAAIDEQPTAAIRAVLERIAADELRHAQLAWRTLAWLLRGADDHDRRWAIGVLDHAIGRVGTTGSPIHREAARRVLAPVARALG